ncbi:MAG TPA: DUF4129 domain-containing protein [Blastocatellia bacterium]|nr:DUF4129 domain-containing protein [Blastocatellia bacterium]
MKKALTILLIVTALEVGALAEITLLAYGQRVVRAAEQIDRIKADRQYSDEGVASIKELLPRSEEVKVESGTVVVDNSWLHTLLDEYKSENDPQQRLAILNEASGRLNALFEHLQTEEGEGEGPRKKVQEILGRSEYREKGEDRLTALIKRIRTEILSFFQDLLTRIFMAIQGAGTGASWLFRGLLIFVLVLAIALAVRMAMRMERKKKKGRKRTVLGEEIEEGTTAHDLAEAAFAAARAGDFRLAVRRLYISLLYEMAEHNLVELEAGATNRDYLERVSRFSTLSSMMRYLTDRFEYFWYGMFSPTEEDFAAYSKTYESGLESVRLLGNQAE